MPSHQATDRSRCAFAAFHPLRTHAHISVCTWGGLWLCMLLWDRFANQPLCSPLSPLHRGMVTSDASERKEQFLDAFGEAAPGVQWQTVGNWSSSHTATHIAYTHIKRNARYLFSLNQINSLTHPSMRSSAGSTRCTISGFGSGKLPWLKGVSEIDFAILHKRLTLFVSDGVCSFRVVCLPQMIDSILKPLHDELVRP